MFVKFVPGHLSDRSLQNLVYEKSGIKPLACRVILNSQGKSKGMAFIDL